MNKGKQLIITLLIEKLQQLTNKKVELNEDNLFKKFEITFTNPNFYISDNTIIAFINQLKNLDKNLIFNSKESGVLKRGKIIYIKSNILSTQNINTLIKEFVKKYESLSIVVVVKG
jgi:hypothetical protein